MKSRQPADSNERLSAVMHEWRVDAPLPPRFQEQVWQRIARAEVPAASPFWTGLRRLFEAVIPRPAFAYSYVAAFLVLGVAAGAATAQMKNNQLGTTLSVRYVQLVDPYHAEPSQP